MNVCFHVLTAGGIAHVAAMRMALPSASPAQATPVAGLVAAAATAAVLSHGVLDGLKHGYPIDPALDVVAGAVVALVWCAAVQRRYLVLFLLVMAGSLAPDVIDLGPSLVRSALGFQVTSGERAHFFPWHWEDGSGSMYPGGIRAPEGKGILDVGRNREVSLVNHSIIAALALCGVAVNRRVFRFSGRRPG
ncbi:MAG TPA: hypothetical protein VF615_18515 [Longimicrobiaceae bacterium]|jgi:hypothetical protein